MGNMFSVMPEEDIGARSSTTIKGNKVSFTMRTGREVTKAYIPVKKTSLRTTPKKPKALRGRP